MELIPITELDKQEICGWHYQGLYQIYNLPSYAEMKVSSMGFASPEKEKNFYVWRENGHLIGYVNLLEKPDGLFIGIGIQPTLCGQHYGRRLLTEAVRLAQGKSAPGINAQCVAMSTWDLSWTAHPTPKRPVLGQTNFTGWSLQAKHSTCRAALHRSEGRLSHRGRTCLFVRRQRRAHRSSGIWPVSLLTFFLGPQRATPR